MKILRTVKMVKCDGDAEDIASAMSLAKQWLRLYDKERYQASDEVGKRLFDLGILTKDNKFEARGGYKEPGIVKYILPAKPATGKYGPVGDYISKNLNK
jgi:hypothetical protein